MFSLFFNKLILRKERLNSFFLLKDRLLDVNNEALIQAKASAYNQNSWFLPDFIEKSITQIAQQFLTKEALMDWTAAYPQIADKMTHKKVGIVMACCLIRWSVYPLAWQ